MARPVHLRAVPPAPDLPTLEEAFRSHAGYVAGVAYRILGRSGEVEDVVQDVFLKAVVGLVTVREPDAIRPWLATITVRVARRRIRSRWWRDFFGPQAHGAPDLLAASTASPEQAVLVRELYRVLDRLPVDQRLAWSVRYIEGERLEAVAILCECSLATAKRRIAAAQLRIEKELDGE
ncbi:MAG TPA: RNA polymerase sigma factor [Kofleriaceae bacterium]|nr:RNA polymerase sigma factor [Kofleriaceae bacterium]